MNKFNDIVYAPHMQGFEKENMLLERLQGPNAQIEDYKTFKQELADRADEIRTAYESARTADKAYSELMQDVSREDADYSAETLRGKFSDFGRVLRKQAHGLENAQRHAMDMRDTFTLLHKAEKKIDGVDEIDAEAAASEGWVKYLGDTYSWMPQMERKVSALLELFNAESERVLGKRLRAEEMAVRNAAIAYFETGPDEDLPAPPAATFRKSSPSF